MEIYIVCITCLVIFELVTLNFLLPVYLNLNLLVFASEQQPLRLNPVEVCEVIAAVCSETSNVKSNQLTVSSKLRHSGRPSMDAAVSVLVKLVIDM